MITGPVVDPTLSLDNVDIARRHVRAFLLQRYLQDRVAAPKPGAKGGGDLFSVLGKLSDFRLKDTVLNRTDFEEWLKENEAALKARLLTWIPVELTPGDRQALQDDMIEDCLAAIDKAILNEPEQLAKLKADSDDGDDEENTPEVQPETDDALQNVTKNARKLLDTLLYNGVLPRYAFPTDVATFHVFDQYKSTRFKKHLEFAPSQGLSVALTQYAPGRQIWIAGKCYTSGAIYTPMPGERSKQWEDKKLYLECNQCGFAYLQKVGGDVAEGHKKDCPACHGAQALGPARHWFRPTGFAHPINVPVLTSPDDLPEVSYATRAKLTMRSDDVSDWVELPDRIRYFTLRTHLLVSNTGPSRKGYSYCPVCGRIEATTAQPALLVAGRHDKPYPDEGRQSCNGHIAREVMLGTDFITDVALFSIKVAEPIRLKVTDSISHVALRTLCEALARAATNLLAIEPGEIMAEFRPALTETGVQGFETEIFLYDTLPGGAGFAKEAARKGLKLFLEARKVMSECKDNCPLSCYRCLRNFRNRLDHGALDRHTGIGLIDYLLTNQLPTFDNKRIETATALLHADIDRQGTALELSRIDNFTDESGRKHQRPILAVKPSGEAFVFSTTNSLYAERDSVTVQLGERIATIIDIPELLIRKNLGEATKRAMFESAS